MDDATRACAWCGGDMKGRSARALTCSPGCSRKRNNQAQNAKTLRRYPAIRCPACGSDFKPSRSDSKWCSLPCARRAKYVTAVERNEPKTCPKCGETFTPRRSDAVFCSPLCCQRQRKNIPGTRACGTCEADISDAAPRVKFCPPCKASRLRDYRNRANERNRKTPRKVHCVACGIAFRSHSKRAKTCSSACGEWSRKYPGTPRDRQRACPTCRLPFTARSMSQRYCGRYCMWSANRYRRRTRTRKARHEPIDPRQIYERDRWICGLCRKRINRRLKHPHPMSASLDHIFPLSLGGDHVRENVHAAHLRCNISKNNRGGNEQLLLIG